MARNFNPRKFDQLQIKKRIDILSDAPISFDDARAVSAKFNSTRKMLEIDPAGYGFDRKGLALPHDRWGLVERFEKLPQLTGVTQLPAANTYSTADFLAQQKANREFELLGTSAVSADVTRYAEGGILLATHGASADSSIILPHLTAGQSPWTGVTWGTDKELIHEIVIETAASVASMAFWLGLKLTNTPTVATDNDQVMVHFDTGSLVSATKLRTVYSIGGTDVDAATGPTVAINTKYHVKIAIGSDRKAKIWVNGDLLVTSGALTDATDLIPYIGVKALTAAVKSIRVYQQALSRKVG